MKYLLLLLPALLLSKTLEEKKCDNGNAKICHSLGDYLISQNKVPEALSFYEKGCFLKHEPSCRKVGEIYLSGDIEVNYDKAIDYLSVSCDKDNFESCHDLAIIFSEGKGTTIDNWKATNLYNVACDNNFSRSCHNLALLKVEELNFIEAEKLYKKSCLLNNYASCLNLGNMYYYGDLGVTNFDLANNYYSIACENNYADGCYNLAFSYFDGSGVESDLETGMILLEKACTLGNEKACTTFKESL